MEPLLEEAEALARQSISIHELVLGASALETLHARIALTKIYSDARQFQQAQDLAAELARVSTDHYGTDHEMTLRATQLVRGLADAADATGTTKFTFTAGEVTAVPDAGETMTRRQRLMLTLLPPLLRITPVSMAETIRDGIPGAQLVVLPVARHLANMEDVAGFNKALRDFIDAH